MTAQDSLLAALPPVDMFRPRTDMDYYGAASAAARYCGFAAEPTPVTGRWQHGWMPEHRQLFPAMVFGHQPKTDDRPCLVATELIAAFLRERGFRHARAIGSPLIYVEGPPAKREPGTLLVMPVHSLAYTTHQWNFDQYADEILAIHDDFARVIVCVHPSCWDKGYWVDAFQNRGIEVIHGASVKDRNALLRIHRLMTAVEFVTTNGLGSHIAYASYLGAKPSIYGTYSEYSAEDFANDPLFTNNPEALQPTLHAYSKSAVQENLPHLFCHPAEAQQHVEWGERQLGADVKVTPRAMRKLFGWRMQDRVNVWWGEKREGLTRRIVVPLARRYCPGVLSKDYQQDNHITLELHRLWKLGANATTTTTLLGPRLIVPHVEEFLKDYERIFETDAFKFSAKDEHPYIVEWGAKAGYGTIYFKKTFPQCQIVAVEPDPPLFKVLQTNCESFGIRDVTWGQPQPEATATRALGCGNATQPNTSRSQIETPTLTNFLKRPVDLLKIDIRGEELAILQQCKDMLPNVRHLIVVYYSLFNKPQTLTPLLMLFDELKFRVHCHSVRKSTSPLYHQHITNDNDQVLYLFGVRMSNDD